MKTNGYRYFFLALVLLGCFLSLACIKTYDMLIVNCSSSQYRVKVTLFKEPSKPELFAGIIPPRAVVVAPKAVVHQRGFIWYITLTDSSGNSTTTEYTTEYFIEHNNVLMLCGCP